MRSDFCLIWSCYPDLFASAQGNVRWLWCCHRGRRQAALICAAFDRSNLSKQIKKSETKRFRIFHGAASQIWTGDLILTNGIFAVLSRFIKCEKVLICKAFYDCACHVVRKLWRPFYNLGRHLVAKSATQTYHQTCSISADTISFESDLGRLTALSA